MSSDERTPCHVCHKRDHFCRNMPENLPCDCKPIQAYPLHLQAAILFNKNKFDVKCARCECVVLKAGSANIVQLDSVSLPMMQRKKDLLERASGDTENSNTTFPEETLHDFWFVDNIYDFENVGFSHTVAQRKFLVCADCEIGPIGFHDLDSRKAYYIAVERVRNVPSAAS